METMPPVILGAIVLTSFVFALALGALLRPRIVGRSPEISQPKRAFMLELGLCLFAGLLMNTYNMIFYAMPLINTSATMVGVAVAGFFIGLDSALARERYVIQAAMSRDDTLPLPKHLFSITRKFSFVALMTTLFIATVMALVFARDIVWLSKIGQDDASIAHAQMSVTTEIVFIMAALMVLVVNLIISFSRNLRLLFNNETQVLELVSRGDLSRKVPVATSDEFGIIAGHTNQMIDGLRHRSRLVSALKLAEEVQQNLLPRHDPQVAGLDIAGTSIYCDETGGDYYDYFRLPRDRWAIVVADASDHGVGAAMHMTTIRAFLHFGIRDYENPVKLLKEVNRHATRDSARTGRFMSMFFLEIDPKNKTLRWVRAGHEPALVYDRVGNTFNQLDGKGIVLGVDDAYEFEESSRENWNPGDLLLVGTDGISETRNENDQMFGQQRLQQVIQANADASAKEINNQVIDSVRQFRGSAPQEDDVTLVVVKLL